MNAVRAFWLILVVALIASACSQGDNAVLEINKGEPEVDPAVEQVRERAQVDLDAPEERIQIDDPLSLSPSGCRIYGAWDIEVLDGGSLYYAVLGDGTVVAYNENRAAERVLDTCVFADGLEPSATQFAQVVLRLGKAPGPFRLVTEDRAGAFSEELGVAYTEPDLTTLGDETTVTFLVEDTSRFVYSRLTVVRVPGSALTYEEEELE